MNEGSTMDDAMGCGHCLILAGGHVMALPGPGRASTGAFVPGAAPISGAGGTGLIRSINVTFAAVLGDERRFIFAGNVQRLFGFGN